MKGIIAVIIVIAVLAGAYYLYKGQQTSQPTVNLAPTESVSPLVSPSPAESVTPGATSSTGASSSAASQAMKASVDYISSGFSPATVTIKSGGTVTWTNKATDPMWVASNPHPVHTDYPGFDALKNIPTDGTYSFTFTKAGTWGYHNHLNPAQKGTVVVEP